MTNPSAVQDKVKQVTKCRSTMKIQIHTVCNVDSTLNELEPVLRLLIWWKSDSHWTSNTRQNFTFDNDKSRQKKTQQWTNKTSQQSNKNKTIKPISLLTLNFSNKCFNTHKKGIVSIRNTSFNFYFSPIISCVKTLPQT